jgi:hypothetical protein
MVCEFSILIKYCTYSRKMASSWLVQKKWSILYAFNVLSTYGSFSYVRYIAYLVMHV